MKKSTLISIVAGLLILGGIAYLLKKGGDSKPTLTQVEQVKQDDIHRLEAQGDELEKAKSLKRMAFQNPEKAREYALKFAKHESSTLRAAAAEVAGGFQGQEWDVLIENGLKDTDRKVRVGALRGLMRQPTAVRGQLVQEFVAKGEMATDETIWSHLYLAHTASENGERASHERILLDTLRRAERDFQSVVLIDLYKMWPARSELVKFAIEVVSRGEQTSDFLPAFRYLASHATDQLAVVLKASSWPESRTFLINVLDFVADKCPKEYAALMKKVESQPATDDEIRRRLEQFGASGTCKSD